MDKTENVPENKCKKYMHFETWSIQGLATKKTEVKTQKKLKMYCKRKKLKMYDMDVIVRTESKEKGKTSEDLEDFIFIYRKVNTDERTRVEVSLLIRRRYNLSINRI